MGNMIYLSKRNANKFIVIYRNDVEGIYYGQF